MRSVPVLALALLGACATTKPSAPPEPAPPRSLQLLAAVAEAPTASRAESRRDLWVSTPRGGVTPSVVGAGEVGPIARAGRRARLYGDADGKDGWSVDNFVLLELLDAKGTVLARWTIGFQQGTRLGAEHLDNLGAMKFEFGPGEIDLSAQLPEEAPFSLRATALDAGGVGKVTDLWLVLGGEAPPSADADLKK